jgi:ferredoxin
MRLPFRRLEAERRIVIYSGRDADANGGCMKVFVDWDLCEANAVCMKVCPEVFELQEDDTLLVKNEHPDESLRAKVEEAVRRCPRQAISIRED